MKLKVGDKARVKETLIAGKDYGVDRFIIEMAVMRGKTVTIDQVYENWYCIQECDYNWTDEMLEPVKKARPMKFVIQFLDGHYYVQGYGYAFTYTRLSDAKRGLNRFIKKIQEGNYTIEVEK